jgi:hypothetical protein
MQGLSGKRRRLGFLAEFAAASALAAMLVFVATGAAGGGVPTNVTRPSISGDAREGEVLTANPGAWNGGPTSYGYQWVRCNAQGASCNPIGGATSQTYTPVQADVGNTLRVQVVASNASGPSEPELSPPTVLVADENAPFATASPSITGTPSVGQTLTAQNGTWTGPQPITFAYQWLRCDQNGDNCSQIGGATQQTYVVQQADSGNTLRVLVIASNAFGPAQAVSAQTAVVGSVGPQNTARPTISGNAVQAQTLTASPGSWTSPNGSPITYAYQWQRCNAQGQACQAIQGATQQTYVLQAADVGNTIVVAVTATNSQGSNVATSTPTGVVQASGGGGSIPVSQVSLPNRLVVAGVQYTPSVLRSRAPFQARFRITDANGNNVSGAQVNIVAVPYGRIAPEPPVTTDQNGFATFTLQPTSRFPLRKGFLITIFVRAIKPGDNILTGVTALRLTSVRINPS